MLNDKVLVSAYKGNQLQVAKKINSSNKKFLWLASTALLIGALFIGSNAKAESVNYGDSSLPGASGALITNKLPSLTPPASTAIIYNPRFSCIMYVYMKAGDTRTPYQSVYETNTNNSKTVRPSQQISGAYSDVHVCTANY